MAKELFKKLVGAHIGATFIIMGGGTTLAADLATLDKKLVKNAIVISTNAHGAEIRKPDYVLAMDEVMSNGKGGQMVPFVREKTDAPIIGPFPVFDYVLEQWPDAPRAHYTGLVAMYVAFLMGAGNIILVGMDAYYDEDQGVSMRPEMVGVAERILTDVFVPVRLVTENNANALLDVIAPYTKGEEFAPVEEMHPALEDYLGIERELEVVCVKLTFLHKKEMKPGARRFVMTNDPEVARLMKHKMIVPYYADKEEA